MACGMNDRVWYYALEGRALLAEREYHGTVQQVAVAEQYAAVLVEGKIILHPYNPQMEVCREAWAPVTIDQLRRLALQMFKKHRASTNILFNRWPRAATTGASRRRPASTATGGRAMFTRPLCIPP